MMLARGARETAQLDQVALVVALQSGIPTVIGLDPQAAPRAQIPAVGPTTACKTKEPGPGRALRRKRPLQLSRGIDPAPAIWRQPLEHESHTAQVLIGDKRAVSLGLEPVAKVDALAT